MSVSGALRHTISAGKVICDGCDDVVAGCVTVTGAGCGGGADGIGVSATPWIARAT